MLQTELSGVATPLQHRHIGAIAALVLISLLSTLNGTPIDHTITNPWEGFLWGMANPVINLNHLVSIVAIGFLSASIGRGPLIAASFVLTGVFGTVFHLFSLHLPGAELAIAFSSIAFGAMLGISNQLHWIFWALLTAIAGLFHGYVNGESIIGAEIVSLVAYVLGITLTQYVVAMTCREINPILSSNIRLTSLTISTLGIVFLHNLMR